MTEYLTEETKNLKKQFARSFHNDGLLDFFVGLILVNVGLFMKTRLTIFSFGWLPILFIAPLKYVFVMPRWGYARFQKSSTIPRPILIGTGIFIVIGALLLKFVFGDYEGFGSPIASAVLLLSLIVVLATGFNRVASYAVFIPLFFVIGFGVGFLTSTLVLFLGGTLMILGISLFVSFLRKYPLIEEKDSSEQD